MKKILFTCFLGYLCLPKSKLIPNWFTYFFCCIGTIFPRHWRDIFIPKFRDYLTKGISPLIGGLFHRRSRSISQAEGLHISRINNHIRGVTIRFVFVLFFGIVIKVNSQVADPPGADLLHKSSSHRSGDTRSDTFYSVAPQDIDGGPGLLSSVSGLPSKKVFSLVDSDQDMRIGLENSSFQSASVSVFGIPILSDRQNVPQKPKTQSLVSCVLGLDTSTSLVDYSISLGQEGAIPSAPSQNIYLRVELIPDSNKQLEPLQILVSSQELDFRYDYRKLTSDTLHLMPGTFLEGTMGVYQGELSLPLLDQFGRMQLMQKGRSILQDIWVQPGDSIRISFEPSSGKVLFLGPNQDPLRLQMQLQDLASGQEQSINPIILTSDANRVLDSPETINTYQKISKNHVSGWNRKMELLTQTNSRFERAKFLFENAGDKHPVFRELARYQDLINPELKDWLRLYWKAKLYKKALEFIYLNKSTDADWNGLLMDHLLEVEIQDLLKDKSEFPMELLESLYIENLLLEGYTEIDFGQLTGSLPHDLRTQVQAFFLVRQYKDLPDSEARILALVPELKNPWLALYMKDILQANLKGKQFLNEPFWNIQGEAVYPASWEGKLVFLDFWLSGCGACMAFAKNKFLPLVEEFGQHPDILFVTISGDSDRKLWESTLEKKHFTTEQTTDLFSGGITHPSLKQYHIQAFPEQLLLDKTGKILQTGHFPSSLEGWRILIQDYLDKHSSSDSVSTSNPILLP